MERSDRIRAENDIVGMRGERSDDPTCDGAAVFLFLNGLGGRIETEYQQGP